MTASIELRPAENITEVERTAEIAAAAFPDRTESFFRARSVDVPFLPIENSLLVIVDGTIVSSLQIHERKCDFGEYSVTIGAIGNVATLPEYRGNGYASKLLNYSVEFLEEKQYAFSILRSELHDFYARFGWEVLPFKRIRVKQPETLESAISGQWILFDKKRYLENLATIYSHEWNSDGAVVRPEVLWDDWIFNPQADIIDESQVQLLVSEGSIVGYLVTEREGETNCCLEYGYCGDNRTEFLRACWNKLIESNPAAIRWDPPFNSDVFEGTSMRPQSIETVENDLCMVQLHTPSAFAQEYQDSLQTTHDLVTMLADETQWYWSNLDKF